MADSIDLVFVSNCISKLLWEMTANAVRTAVDHAGMTVGKVIIVEQCRHAQSQPIGRTLYYDFPFEYNKCLNLGRSLCTSKYMAFCNNDLYFESRWARNAIKAMKKYGYLSVSPSNRVNEFSGVEEGYRVAKRLLGWCIITDREVFEKIGQFDQITRFWYSDNVYGVQLQCAGIKHALVGNSRVRHLTSVTLKKIPPSQRLEFMRKEKKKFDNYKLKRYADTGAKIET